MDHPAVKLWRDQYRLNLSSSWKADVEKTVEDLDLWREVLAKWKREKRHPGIKGILDEYESLEANKRNNETPALSARGGTRLSIGSNSDVSKVRIEPPSLYFRIG